MADRCTTPPPAGCAPVIADPRVLDNFTRRFSAATQQAVQAVPPHTRNGDELLLDRCGTYTKCIKQASPGKVDATAYASFQRAIASGSFADFEAVILGGSRTLNGPMGSYASSFSGADSSQFGDDIVPTPWRLASEEYAAELIELYWCSLLRDVAFRHYGTNSIAHAAAKELDANAFYKGPRDSGGKVTPELLFRGGFSGETTGPYVSQFLVTPTRLGALPVDQRYVTYMPGLEYMTDLASWYAVQNGVPTGFSDQEDPVARLLHNGRALAAYTHVDVLFQAYFTAFLVLSSINAPANPTSPYLVNGLPSAKQNGFGTFGGPDFASVLAQVAKVALNAVWYQKWFVHLRHRPESGGGLIHLVHQGVAFDAQPHATVFNSKAVEASHAKYSSYLLSQPFPEGSPAHPAYPTGHGTVGGACITILKFFFDGNYQLNDLIYPSSDGTALVRWEGEDAIGASGPLTVNGELHKLAHNITFGHGVHGGIHWRSDSDSSIRLGEAVAIRFLEDIVCSYAEPVKVSFTKLDGTTQVIQN